MIGLYLSKLAAGAAGALIAVAVAAVPGDTVALSGVAAVLQGRVAPAVQPHRTMLLSIARAGNRLVAVGEHGTIALSDDNGAKWRNAAGVPVDATLTAVRFADERNGWAVGHLGVVLHTRDGGENWTRQLDGIAIGKLAMVQVQGQTTTLEEAKRLADDGPDKPLLDLLVEDAKRVTVVGAFNLALSTVDGGATWQLISHQFDNPEHLHLYGIARVGRSVVAVGEQSLVLRRSGDRFVPVKSPYEGSLFGVVSTGERLLVVFGLRGHAFMSLDGGANWQASKLPGTGASLNGALRLAHGRIVLYDQAGGVFASADGGVRFERVPFDWGAPITGMVEAADGSLVATSVVGITQIPKTALAAPMAAAGAGALR
ncbi:MAG TPA: YCF48-related protein [Variovorax sp.]|nr:YCF48-related protein [Variovorax sp.]